MDRQHAGPLSSLTTGPAQGADSIFSFKAHIMAKFETLISGLSFTEDSSRTQGR
jgi:hypothetical protein